MDIGKPQRVIEVEPLRELPIEPTIPAETEQHAESAGDKRAPARRGGSTPLRG